MGIVGKKRQVIPYHRLSFFKHQIVITARSWAHIDVKKDNLQPSCLVHATSNTIIMIITSLGTLLLSPLVGLQLPTPTASSLSMGG